MRIGFDIDDTISTNFTQKLLDLYNKKYQDNILLEDITEYELNKFVKPECKNIFREFMTEDFILSLDVPSSTIATIEELSKEHEIYFVTAASPWTVEWRHKLLSKYFKNYTVNQLIMCRNKQLIDLDILVDDNPIHFINTKYKGVVIDKPWNQSLELPYRIGEIFDMIELLKKI